MGKEGKSRDPGSSSKKKAQRFSKSDHEALADIFKKIGKKELSKVGSVLLLMDQGRICLRNGVGILSTRSQKAPRSFCL